MRLKGGLAAARGAAAKRPGGAAKIGRRSNARGRAEEPAPGDSPAHPLLLPVAKSRDGERATEIDGRSAARFVRFRRCRVQVPPPGRRRAPPANDAQRLTSRASRPVRADWA